MQKVSEKITFQLLTFNEENPSIKCTLTYDQNHYSNYNRYVNNGTINLKHHDINKEWVVPYSNN